MALFGKENKTESKVKTRVKAKVSSPSTMQDLYKEENSSKPAKAHPSRIAEVNVLVRPLVTEKATNLAASGKYVFVISEQANKISVAKAIEAVYGVKPVAVNIVNMEGKRVSRGRINGQRSDWRKAIVTLQSGQTIKIYEGV